MSASPADMSIEALILDVSMTVAGEVLPNMRRLKTHPLKLGSDASCLIQFVNSKILNKFIIILIYAHILATSYFILEPYT
jgi:hypothetical protein